MIDTDKYEGHTPGPWWIDKVSDNGETNTWLMGNAPQNDMLFCIEFAEGNDADVRLIADTPLLLAEVKRLREDNELYLACIHASHFRDKPGSAMSKLNQMRFLQRGEEE